MDNKDLFLSKKLIANYKQRLESEIINRSNKLRIPQKISEDIIKRNFEIKELKKALEQIDLQFIPSNKKEG